MCEMNTRNAYHIHHTWISFICLCFIWFIILMNGRLFHRSSQIVLRSGISWDFLEFDSVSWHFNTIPIPFPISFTQFQFPEVNWNFSCILNTTHKWPRPCIPQHFLFLLDGNYNSQCIPPPIVPENTSWDWQFFWLGIWSSLSVGPEITWCSKI